MLTINEEIEKNFKPTRLYIKELNGLKYFGKSVSVDIEKYKGSGKRWLNHVKKYGHQNVKTIWISDWFYCPYHIQSFALLFSHYNNISNSPEWANLMEEDGLSGGSYWLNSKSLQEKQEIYKKVSDTLQSKTIEEKEKTKKKHSESLRNRWLTITTIDRKLHAENTSVGLKKMWNNLSAEKKAERKTKEMFTKNSKSIEEKEEISNKMKMARNKLINRQNVLYLKNLAEERKISLGKNWRAKNDEWINKKIIEWENN